MTAMRALLATAATFLLINHTWAQMNPRWTPRYQAPRVTAQNENVAGPRPQEPKRPFPYVEQEVSYSNSPAAMLSGTLTLPQGPGPFPAVLLITGSGPQNRDEEMHGHKPFLVLSDYLTRRGIAVLRVDDRGVGKSMGIVATATSADLATDALAGVAYLKSRPEIRKDQIGLIGHSEGGMIAALAAEQSKDVAFIVMLAGTGVPGDQVMLEQSSLIARASGQTEVAIAGSRDLHRQMFAVIREEPDQYRAQARLIEIVRESLEKLPEEERQRAGKQLLAQVHAVNSPWMRYFLTHDPAESLRKVSCPVLALNGALDMQVLPKQNLPAIEAALKAGGNTDYTVREIPGLNHMFQTAITGAPSEYALIEETISPVVLEMISDWIKAHTPMT